VTPPGRPVHLDPLSPLALLERTLRVFPDQLAVVYGERRWTWAAFAREIARMAGALRRARVGPGDRVAFLAPNVPELLAAHFAVLQIHAVLVAINTRLAAEEVGYILDHSGAKVVVVDAELAGAVPDRLAARPLRVPRSCRSATTSTTKTASPRSTTRPARPVARRA